MPEVDAPEESIFACSLTEALRKWKPRVGKTCRDKWTASIFTKHAIEASPGTMSLGHFAQHYPAAMRDLQIKLRLRLLVIQTVYINPNAKKKKRHELLYDGRHAIVDHPTQRPLKCIWLARDGRMLMDTDRVDLLPPLAEVQHRRQQFQHPQSLWDILELGALNKEAQCSPSHFQELRDYIQRWRLPDTKVVVKFATGLKPKSLVCDWLEEPASHTPEAAAVNRVIYIVAFTDRRYGLIFAKELEPGLEKARASGQKLCLQWEQYQEQWQKWKRSDQAQGLSNAHQANCSAAVHVQHGGLNLAHDLGLISARELAQLSLQLGQTYSTLYVFLDSEHHLRHVTYYDIGKNFCQEVACFGESTSEGKSTKTKKQRERRDRCQRQAVDAMMFFWQQVWDRRTHWVQQRQQLLQPLIRRIEHLLSGAEIFQSQPQVPPGKSTRSGQIHSPFWRCLKELQSTISRHRLYLYSKEDSHLHSVKFYLVHFAYQRLKCRLGLHVKAQSDDTLMSLSIPGLTVANLHIYLSCKRDVDFFSTLAQPWRGPLPSEIVVSHSRQNLKKQKVILDASETMITSAYCRQFGWMFARHIFRYWIEFGQYILQTFGYDIQGQANLPSASFMAFQCIWTLYIQKAGPMAHGLERSKPYYEDLLRQQSKGGFMYSVGDSLNQGQALHPPEHPLTDPSKRACSIAEFDLVSAYGFSAARSRMPSGFCIGYEKLKCDSEARCLHRLDPRLRHKSFEFRAVYKTIDKLTRRQGFVLRSVYHNYSPLGLFTLGKYNLDLAVVHEDGKVLLINFDGRHYHGCDQCPPTGLFAHGQSHEQLRCKSRRRDDDIQAWVAAVNANAQKTGGPSDLFQYMVIHDCHSPGFTTKELKRAFASEPTLMALVEGYQLTDTCGIELTAQQFQQELSSKTHDDSFTFILKADVAIDSDADWGTAGPFVVYESVRVPPPTDDAKNANYFTLDGRCKRNKHQQRLAWRGSVVLTRDYYQWLRTSYGDQFYVQNLDWILFYKTEPALNDIYQQLVDWRSTTSDPVLVSFIKKLVNLSAGFYGLRSAPLAAKTTYRFVNKMPKNYAFFRHHLDTRQSFDLGESSYFLLESKPFAKVDAIRSPSKSAVPLFLTIVEYGKLRLVQIIHFLQQHLVPGSFRLLYSNIDNLILALAHPARCLDEAVRPECLESFQSQRSLYFVTPDASGNEPLVKRPGLAECKWSRHHLPWRFVTLRTQHYCLASEDAQQNLYKASGWSGVTAEQVLEWTEKLASGERVDIPQKRRTHKKMNLDTKDVVLHL